MVDCSQLILSLTLIKTKHQIELGLKEKASKKHRQYKVANMKAAVDEWADFSAQQLENRLDRIWKQKQKEVNVNNILNIELKTTMAGILPTGLIPKTTQNYKPLWVPNPKIPMEFRDKPNPTHTHGFFRVG